MLSEWVNIYMHLFTMVMGDRVPEDLRKESLSNYQMGPLSDLKRWICRQRIKTREERERAEWRQKKEETAARMKATQPTLFDLQAYQEKGAGDFPQPFFLFPH